jgi:hypothetical protein
MELDVTKVVEAKILWVEYEEKDGTMKPVLVIPDGVGYIILKDEVAGRRNMSRVSAGLAKNIDIRRGMPSRDTAPEKPAIGQVMEAVGVEQL